MTLVTLLFSGLLLACVGIFGLAVKAMMLSVYRPEGGKVRKVSTLAFGTFIVFLSLVMAGVFFSAAAPSLGRLACLLVVAFLCSLSAAIQVARAFAKKPAEAAPAEASEPVEQAAEPSATVADTPVAPAVAASSAAPVAGIVAATAAAAVAVPAVAASSSSVDFDPMDAWAEENVPRVVQPQPSRATEEAAQREAREERLEPTFDIDDAIAEMYTPPAPTPVAMAQEPLAIPVPAHADMHEPADALVRTDAVDRVDTFADASSSMSMNQDPQQTTAAFSDFGQQQEFSLQPA
jgi:hypothetical protein